MGCVTGAGRCHDRGADTAVGIALLDPAGLGIGRDPSNVFLKPKTKTRQSDRRPHVKEPRAAAEALREILLVARQYEQNNARRARYPKAAIMYIVTTTTYYRRKKYVSLCARLSAVMARNKASAGRAIRL